MINVAINGFGRIGRSALKLIFQNKKMRLVAINDLGDINNLAYLLKFDTVQGRYEKQVKVVGGNLMVGTTKIAVSKEMDPAKIPWKKLKVDVVLECTGVFTKKEDAAKHLQAGAKKVLISAMSKSDGLVTVVRGVNDSKAKNQKIVANASCTTNCVAPIMSVIDDAFGVEKSLLTTVHAITASERTVDLANPKDWREGRAAGSNIIPSTTGAAIATAITLPQLKDKFDGISLRVPVICGSISDIVILTKKNVTVEEVNKVLLKASKTSRYKGIIEVSEDELVSTDILGTTASLAVF